MIDSYNETTISNKHINIVCFYYSYELQQMIVPLPHMTKVFCQSWKILERILHQLIIHNKIKKFS